MLLLNQPFLVNITLLIDYESNKVKTPIIQIIYFQSCLSFLKSVVLC